MLLLYICSFLILCLYFISGITKVLYFENTVSGLKTRLQFKTQKDIFHKMIIIAVILIEIFSPIIIITLLKQKHIAGRIACYILSAFTVMATFLYHWPPNKHMFNILSNINAVGSLILLSLYFK